MSTRSKSRGRGESAEVPQEGDLDAAARRKAERSRTKKNEAAFRIVSRPNRRRRPPTYRELFMQIAHEKIPIKDEKGPRDVTRIEALVMSLFRASFSNPGAKYLPQLFELMDQVAPETDEAKLRRLHNEVYRKGGSMIWPDAVREMVDAPEAPEIDYEDDGCVDEFSSDSDNEALEVSTEPEQPSEEE